MSVDIEKVRQSCVQNRPKFEFGAKSENIITRSMIGNNILKELLGPLIEILRDE